MIINTLIPTLGLALIVLSAQRTSFNQRLSMKTWFRMRLILSSLPFFGVIFGLSPVVLWALIGSLCAFLRIHATFFGRTAVELTLEEVLHLFDRTILSMKSGRSLRVSLREAAADSPPVLSRLLHNIIDRLEHGVSNGKSAGLSAEIAAELRRVELRGSRMTESLESFRRDLRMRADFRRKSGQLTLQTRVQAILALLLYLPLLWVQIRSGNLITGRTFLSLGLFVASQLWIHLTFRSFRWKV